MLCILVLNLQSPSSKIYDVSNRGPLDVKWRGVDFTVLLTSSNAAVCHNKNNCSAISSQMHCRLPTPSLRPNTNPAGGSGLWHSALKFRPLTIAIHGTAISFVAIRLESTAICQYSIRNLPPPFYINKPPV
jgi:hypothetical protein